MSRKHPTEKQMIATQLIAKGMSGHKAMLKAGYSKSTALNAKQNLLMSPNITKIIDRMKIRLESEGITGEYLAAKLGQFAKDDNPKVFFPAYDRIKDVIGITPNIKDDPEIKRQFTFTEYVSQLPDRTQSNNPAPQELIEVQPIDPYDKVTDPKDSGEPRPTEETPQQAPIKRDFIDFKKQARHLQGYSDSEIREV